MMISNKKIKIWYGFENNECIEIFIPNLESPKTLYSFLFGDIQFSEDSCKSWIKIVDEAKDNNDYFYDSFGNCCTTTVTHQGVTIENEYTDDLVKNISLDDMQIILEKWLDFIKTRKTIEFCW